MDLASALRMPSPVWINIAPEKSFQSIRSLSTQSSSQSHTRPIHFLTDISYSSSLRSSIRNSSITNSNSSNLIDLNFISNSTLNSSINSTSRDTSNNFNMIKNNNVN